MSSLNFVVRLTKLSSRFIKTSTTIRCLSSISPPEFNTRPAIPTGDAARLQNKKLRIDLAAAYREFDRLNFNEAIDNHLSVMAPAADGSGKEVMLIHPYGIHYSEVQYGHKMQYANNLRGLCVM